MKVSPELIHWWPWWSGFVFFLIGSGIPYLLVRKGGTTRRYVAAFVAGSLSSVVFWSLSVLFLGYVAVDILKVGRQEARLLVEAMIGSVWWGIVVGPAVGLWLARSTRPENR